MLLLMLLVILLLMLKLMLLMKLLLMLNLVLIRRIVCLTAGDGDGDSWSCESVSSVQEGVFQRLFQSCFNPKEMSNRFDIL